MSVGGVWAGFKSVILILERVDMLAARLDEACTKLELLADRVNEIRVANATLENEQKHMDTKMGSAAILATERLNRELLDRISDLESRLDEIQSPPRIRPRAAALLATEARSALTTTKRKRNDSSR